MNVISSVMSRFGRVFFNGGGALISAVSTGCPALMIAAMAGTVFGADLTWVGDDSSNQWDINTSQMWNDGSGVAVYTDGDGVTLDDTGSASPSIDLTATVQPASVMVIVTNKSYAITGTGTLAGAMTLTKSGTNTLALCTTNTFSGTVTVSGGILEFAPPNSLTMNNTFTGTGTIRKSGANTMIIGGTEAQNISFTGPVVVDGGTLQCGTSSGNKKRGLYKASSYTVNNGAVLYVNGMEILYYNTGSGYTQLGPVTLNGSTLKSNGYSPIGPITLNGATLEAVNGYNASYRAFSLVSHVTVIGTAPSYIKQTGSSNVGISLSPSSGASPSVKTFTVADVTGDADADLTVSVELRNSTTDNYVRGITKAGTGTMVLSAANRYTGVTTVTAGSLLVSGSLASPTVNVNNGGTLLVSGSSPLPSALVTVASNGTFGAAGTVATSVTNLTFAEGGNVSWTYEGGARTAGLVNVTGTLTLPTAATVNLAGTGALRSDQVLFSAATVEGATDLSGWTINNVPEGTYASVLLIDNQVILKTVRGTVIQIL